jgi:class 3 adenylate cyclase
MNCPACGAETPDDNRFCGACGAPQIISCTGCGKENPAANKFCGGCGAPMQGQPKPEAAKPAEKAAKKEAPVKKSEPAGEAERRQLTVMFCDLVGSTALSGQLDPEDLREVMQAYRETCAEMIERYDGHVAKYLGDGVLAYFGYPRAHEDDAERAAHAGRAILDAMAELNVKQSARIEAPLETRIGVATGLVVVGDMGAGETRESMSVMGETPNIAARLQALAEPGQIVVGALTRRLIGSAFAFEDLGEHEVKGVALPLRAYALKAEEDTANLAPADAPLLGREVEMARLEACWGAVKGGAGRIAAVSGEPGIGKSRLLRSLQDKVAAEGGAWLECAGSPYHGSTPFHPLIELLRRSAGLERSDAPAARLRKLEALLARLNLDGESHLPILADLLSLQSESKAPELSPRARKERTQESLSAFLAAVAGQQPTVLAAEDLHWFDASSLEMLDRLAVEIAGKPLLVLVSHRPDFSHAWPQGAVETAKIALKRLDSDASALLVKHIAGQRTLADEVVAQIVVRTDGVPSFIEEVTKAIFDAGVLKERKGQWELKGALPERLITETLKDSLTARLDNLAEAKELAQIGAAIGRSFTHELIEAVAKMEAAVLGSNLGTLRASGVIDALGEAPAAI